MAKTVGNGYPKPANRVERIQKIKQEIKQIKMRWRPRRWGNRDIKQML